MHVWCVYTFKDVDIHPKNKGPAIISPRILLGLEFYSLRALKEMLTYQLCAGPHKERMNELNKSIDSSMVHGPTTPSPIKNI